MKRLDGSMVGLVSEIVLAASYNCEGKIGFHVDVDLML
jgi:hypothetical protein